jgi:hypothetical protein
MRPAAVAPATTAARPQRTFKVRAYLDEDYAAQTPRADARIGAQLDRASKVLAAQFGVVLELESVRPWRRAERQTPLAIALRQLAELDAGAGVDWVIGFVSSLQMYTATQEELGAAAIFGRHFVLRGMISVDDATRIEIEFDKIGADAREGLLRELRLHRETAVLLHEWAHTLGAVHDRSGEHLLSASYHKAQATFSATSARLIELGLQWRTRERAGWARALREELAQAGEAVDERERAQALAAAAQLLEAPATPAAAAPPPADGQASLLLQGRQELERGDTAAALQTLARAESGMSAASAAADWITLAQLHARAQGCSTAERAADHASTHPAAAVVVSDCKRLRSWIGLARDASVAEEREPAYAAAMQAALAQGDVKGAEAAAAALEQDYPSAAGAALVRCHAAARWQTARAKKPCRAAAQSAPEAVFPQYVLGRLAAADGRLSQARQALEKALSLDDSAADVWLSLGAVLFRSRDSAALGALKARYRERFGRDMKLGD